MAKRLIGVLLVIAGIIGLVMGAYYLVNRSANEYNIKLMAVYGVLGLVFFSSGIGLVRNTKDVIKKDEHVS